jgi:serine O-acetyltransferase
MFDASGGLQAANPVGAGGSIWRSFARDLSRAWPDVHGLRAAWYVLTEPGLMAVLLVRVQIALHRTPLRPLARIVRFWNLVLFGIDWVPGATAGPGLVVRHPQGIVVGGGVTLDRDVTLLQNVTLGQRAIARGGINDNPTIERGVIIGAGAVVIGRITIGQDAVVGANAVVTRSIPAGLTVMGAPARPRNKVV